MTHLIRRFFEVLRARPLDPTEQSRAAGWLRGGEARLFWAQPVADQRHGLASADLIADQHPARLDLIRAALLHDIGKRHARLGIAGRTAASLIEIAHLPAAGRIAAYLNHGPIGAEELAAAGAEDLVVGFAREHHGARPATIPGPDWGALVAADS